MKLEKKSTVLCVRDTSFHDIFKALCVLRFGVRVLRSRSPGGFTPYVYCPFFFLCTLREDICVLSWYWLASLFSFLSSLLKLFNLHKNNVKFSLIKRPLLIPISDQSTRQQSSIKRPTAISNQQNGEWSYYVNTTAFLRCRQRGNFLDTWQTYRKAAGKQSNR